MNVASKQKIQSSEQALRGWTTVAMLFAVQVINRADKAVLGLAAALIMTDLGLSPERYGLIASSFYFLYAATGLVVGYFFAYRYRPRIILAVLIAVWSLAQLPIVFAASFGTLLVARIILGMGEGNGTPTCINACHEWFPSEKRNLPTSIVMLGATMGSLISAPILSMVMHKFGWHAAFAACALAGGFMFLVWILFSRDGPHSGIAAAGRHADLPAGKKSLRLLADPSVYGSFIMGFSSDWVVGFTLAWLPAFCTLALGFSLVQTGWILSIIFLVQSVVMLAVSALSELLVRRGVSTRLSRAVLNAVCLLLGAACLVMATQVSGANARLALVGIGVGLPIVTFTINPTLLAEIFPSRHRNRLIHMLLSAGTVASMIAPWLTGKIVGDNAVSGWSNVLLINAAVLAVGGVAALALINPAKSAKRLRELDETA